jgi:hypothetical protein
MSGSGNGNVMISIPLAATEAGQLACSPALDYFLNPHASTSYNHQAPHCNLY